MYKYYTFGGKMVLIVITYELSYLQSHIL